MDLLGRNKRTTSRGTKVTLGPQDSKTDVVTNVYSFGIKKKKILCRVWQTMDAKDDKMIDNQINTKVRVKLFKQKKVSMGQRMFTIKVNKTQENRYLIDYNELKEDRKYFVYDCDLLSGTGALSFFRYDLESCPANQNETLLQEGAVQGFIAKGGIPKWIVLATMLMALMAVGGLIFIAPDYINQGKQLDSANAKIQLLTGQNAILNNQLTSAKNTIQAQNQEGLTH